MPSHGVLRAGELLAAGVLAGVVFVAVLAASAVWLWRTVRHRMGVLGPAVAGRARGAAAVVGSAGPRWVWSLPVRGREVT